MMEQALAQRNRSLKPGKPRQALTLTHPNAAGIDIGGAAHYVAVPPERDAEPVREFASFTADLHALADWLQACGVDTVAMESTGVYWIPVYEVLEQRGLKVWLVDARQMKYVPGRKSDVQDCQWLQKLMRFGLLRGAWRPGDEVCVVRAVVRQREVLLAEQASWVQRMLKALVQMNIQLSEVLTDVMGMTGQAIIRDIVAGQREPAVLAKHRNARVKASATEVPSPSGTLTLYSLPVSRRYHWITSSARSSSDCGIVMPSAFAVFRLMTSSNLVGCSTGRSAGLVPRRTLST